MLKGWRVLWWWPVNFYHPHPDACQDAPDVWHMEVLWTKPIRLWHRWPRGPEYDRFAPIFYSMRIGPIEIRKMAEWKSTSVASR